MRLWVLVAVAACSKAPARAAAHDDARSARHIPDAPRADLPRQTTYDDLGAALRATIPADARVIGFGELHSRTDRAQVTSTLGHFTTEALPALADKLSDLVVETWIVDGKCGSAAQEATTKIQTTMRRPDETRSEIGDLAEAARKAGVQPLAMTVGCADYAKIAPAGKEVDAEAMLTLTTSELTRVTTEAIAQRDAEAKHRAWIAVYGGALHNDRFPDPAVAEWSYAAKIDAASHDHFVEIDLIVPELADGDPAQQKQPWFPLVAVADRAVHVWQRGERSFVFVLPKAGLR